MRIRTVKPEFWRDVKLHGLPLDVRLTFIGLWNIADDSGYMRWEPEQIAMDLYPDLDSKERVKLVSRAATALARRGRLIRLPCGHAIVPNLPRHQHLAGATKQVHTFRNEHTRGGCPRVPAGPRLGKVRLGKERLGEEIVDTNNDARGGMQSIGDLMPDLNPDLKH